MIETDTARVAPPEALPLHRGSRQKFYFLHRFSEFTFFSAFTAARCVSHTLKECVGYHTLISNLVCGILYRTLFHSNFRECVGHSKFECVGQSSDKT